MKQFQFLSKSKYIAGLQCLKLLWMYYHAEDEFPPTDSATQAVFNQGYLVNDLAHSLFPGGIEIPGTTEYDKILRESQSLLSCRKPLFEAAFKYENTYARADVLNPRRNGTWDLFEVKSSAGVKDVYLPDVAFQKYCYEGAGLKINKAYVVHINNRYIKSGTINSEELLVRKDVTRGIRSFFREVKTQLKKMMRILGEKKCPCVKIGPHCDTPYPCPLKEICWDFVPKESVFAFNRIQKVKAFRMIHSGVLKIQDVKQVYSLSSSQKIQWICHRENRIHINAPGVQEFLRRLRFPIHFLDFETVGTAIPFYDQSRPFQQIPFQFSLHILSGWDREAVHHSFLAEGKEDPRPEFLSALKSQIEGKGTILSYNMSFELGRLKDCVEIYQEYREWVEGIKDRFMDLIVPFRRFDYYDPKQMGRTSIKNVFPALTGGSYEGMGIFEGEMASNEFARITFVEGISAEERNRVRGHLEEYCKLDTQAMIDILKVLKSAAEGKGGL